MSLPLVALAAASFACVSPRHHDGDNVRCANVAETIRLQGIDAPEMPGACRPGRRCTPGDPFAARDHLRGLTRGKTLQCQQEDVDQYGRIIARCAADGVDLSCAMIAAGQAVPRYAALDCAGADGGSPAPVMAPPSAPMAAPHVQEPPIDDGLRPLDAPSRMLPGWPLFVAGWLLLINLATYMAFAIDKSRARAGRQRRLPERLLHNLATLGGSPAAWLAISRLRHKSAKDSFKQTLIIITGVQIGVLLGGLWWWLGG